VRCHPCVFLVLFLQTPSALGDRSTVDAPPPEKNAVDNQVGATFDTGIGKRRTDASSFGARFIRLHPFVFEGPGAAWLGYGADVRVATIKFRGVDAGLAHLVARAGAGAGTGGVELEGALGAGVGERVVPVGSFAVLFSPLPVFGIGISAQYPIGNTRPQWLEVVQFSFRLQLPLEPCRSRFMNCTSNGQRTESGG
jgi:hypothetical protein